MNIIKIEQQDLLMLARATDMVSKCRSLQSIHATMRVPNREMVLSACQSRMIMQEVLETVIASIKEKYKISFEDYIVNINDMELSYA